MNVTVTDPTNEAIRLMETVLRDGRPIAREYPLVFQDGFPGRVIVKTVPRTGAEPEVVAGCAILPRRLVTPSASFDVGLVGSVATAAPHRGRGFGKDVLATAEAALTQTGAVCSMLWADDAGWYREQGWIPVGTEYVFVLHRGLELLMPDPDHVREATPSDFAAIHALYTTQPTRVDRAVAESCALLAGPGIRTLVAEREGDVVAYAALGRGEDLRNVVHEWAGPIEDVLALVRAHLEACPSDGDGVYVMVPPGGRDIAAFFDFTRTPGAQGILCMAKLASLDAAVELLGRVTPDTVSVSVVDAEQQRIRLDGPGGAIVLTGHEVLLTLFPPRSDRKVIEVVENDLGVALPLLPLEPFLWGLDSI
ncbi:MAG: GNAT family N-acetyltransferase [Planctomycetota bacterium]